MNLCKCHDFQLLFLKDLQIRSHDLDGCHHFPQLCFSFATQNIESPSVLQRDVVEDEGIRRNEDRLKGPSLGGESVNADAHKLWLRT